MGIFCVCVHVTVYLSGVCALCICDYVCVLVNEIILIGVFVHSRQPGSLPDTLIMRHVWGAASGLSRPRSRAARPPRG